MTKGNSLFKIDKKIVLITGVSGQLGEAFAKLYLENGCIVYGVDIKKNKLKNKKYVFLKSDITKKKNISKILNYIIKVHKKIDILINNAAVSYFSELINRNDKEIDKTYEVNLKSVINLITEYFKIHKIKKLKSSRIINIGSIYGVNSPDFKIYSKGDRFSSDIYGATKAGVIQITKYYSVLLAKHNILINTISPGGIKNKKIQNKKFQSKYSKIVPLARMGNVEDLFTALLFLSSDNTSYITGQNLIIDGGLTIK